MAKPKSIFVKALNKYKLKYVVLAFWIIALGFSVWLGPRFLTATTNKFEAPAGSSSDIAQALLESSFNRQKTVDFALFVYSMDNRSILGEALQNWTLALNHSVYNFSCHGCVKQFASYYTLLADGLLPQVAESLLGPNNTTMIIEIESDFPGMICSLCLCNLLTL